MKERHKGKGRKEGEGKREVEGGKQAMPSSPLALEKKIEFTKSR